MRLLILFFSIQVFASPCDERIALGQITRDGLNVALASGVNAAGYFYLGLAPFWPPVLHPDKWTDPERPRLRKVARALMALRLAGAVYGAEQLYENRAWLEYSFGFYEPRHSSLDSRVNAQLEAWAKAYAIKFNRPPTREEIEVERREFFQILR